MKWNLLPHAESDYIFAIIGEELGFLGCLVVVTLYGVLAYAGFRIARRSADRFIQLASVAITVWLVGQAAMNMGYVVGLLPVTGVQLPLISAGGTSLVLTLFIVGLLARFARAEPAAIEAERARDRGRLARLFLPVPEAAVDPVRPRRRPEDRPRARPVAGRRPGSRGPRPAPGLRAASPGASGPVRRRPRGSSGRAAAARAAEHRAGRRGAPAGTSSRCSPSPTRCAAGRDGRELRITCLGTARGHGDPAGPGPRLRPAADPAGAAAAQADRRPAAGARPGPPVRSRETARAARRAGAPTSWSGSAATSPCPPTSPPGARSVPVVVHEQNPLPGLANRIGARFAARVGGRPCRARRCRRREHVGMPLRRGDHARWTGRRCGAEARAAFGLDADRPTLLVFGGSQGAATLNRAAVGAADALTAAGVQVLHARGPEEHRRDRAGPPGRARRPTSSWTIWSAWTSPTPPPTWRSAGPGAVTVAELSAVGLPAAFVPLPIGNGEQRLNALPVVEAGGGLLVDGRRPEPGLDRSAPGAAAHRPAALAGYAAARRRGRRARRRRAAGRRWCSRLAADEPPQDVAAWTRTRSPSLGRAGRGALHRHRRRRA